MYTRILTTLVFFVMFLTGVVSAEPLYLSVKGDSLVNRQGNEVELRGLTVVNGVYTIRDPADIPSSDYGLTAEDYQVIARAGANVVRFHLQYYWLEPRYAPALFQYLDKQITYARQADLYLILNLHYFGTTWSASSGIDDGFFKNRNRSYDIAAFWKKLSDRYKDEPVIAGYDLLNEPSCHERFTEQDLYTFYQRLIDALRENGDNHIVFIADPVQKFSDRKASWYSGDTPFLKLPDSQIVYTFHWYEPYEFTHQTCYYIDTVEIGADYPFLRQKGTYVHGYYDNQVWADTGGSWKLYQGDWVDVHSYVRQSGYDSVSCRFNISLCAGGADGVVWFDDIYLERRDQRTGKVEPVSVRNSALSNARMVYIRDGKPMQAEWPAGWYSGSNTESKGVVFAWDETNDHTGDGSGSLVIDGLYASWSGDPVYASWSQSGGSLPVYYDAHQGYDYRVSAWIMTRQNTRRAVQVQFGIYAVSETIIDRSAMREMINDYYIGWAKKQHVPMLCGEFGLTNPLHVNAYMPLAPEQQVNWIHDTIDVFASGDVHWVYHTYKDYAGVKGGNFGIFDRAVDNRAIQQAVKACFKDETYREPSR